jgi:hypothetical protein
MNKVTEMVADRETLLPVTPLQHPRSDWRCGQSSRISAVFSDQVQVTAGGTSVRTGARCLIRAVDGFWIWLEDLGASRKGGVSTRSARGTGGAIQPCKTNLPARSGALRFDDSLHSIKVYLVFVMGAMIQCTSRSTSLFHFMPFHDPSARYRTNRPMHSWAHRVQKLFLRLFLESFFSLVIGVRDALSFLVAIVPS